MAEGKIFNLVTLNIKKGMSLGHRHQDKNYQDYREPNEELQKRYHFS